MFGRMSMISILRRLNLAGNLRICLDAGDAASAPLSTSTWLDLSGNNYNFFRGATGSLSTDDPAFNGTTGGLSGAEYWSGDGADNFTYDTSNEIWMQTLHKNNAIYTIAAWVYPVTLGNNRAIFETGSQPTDIGVRFSLRQTTGILRIGVVNTSGTFYFSDSSVPTNLNAWNFVAVSVDESAGLGVLQVNGNQDVISPVYISPSSSNASFALRLFHQWDNGARIGELATWQPRALSGAELSTIYETTRERYSI